MKLRRILSSLSNLATEKLYFSSCPSRQIFTARSSSSQRNAGSNLSEALPGNHIKWASLGSVRNSRFASGFTPLQPKPLDSIMDLERAKTKSPEELTSIWDDVILTLSLPPKVSFFWCVADDSFLSVSLRTRSYWDNYESSGLSFVGATSSWVVKTSSSALFLFKWILVFVCVIGLALIFFCLMYQLQPILCHSIVESKWLYYNVCSRFVLPFISELKSN